MRTRLLMILTLLLTGCFGSVNKAYVAADRKKYDAITPYYLRKVAEDEKSDVVVVTCPKCKHKQSFTLKPKLTKEQADIKRKSVVSWKARIDRAEKGSK